MTTEVVNFRIRTRYHKDRRGSRSCVRVCPAYMCISGLRVDVEEGKEALGKLLSEVMGSGSCVASCPPSVILQLSLSLAGISTISQSSTRAPLTPPLTLFQPLFPPSLALLSMKRTFCIVFLR